MSLSDWLSGGRAMVPMTGEVMRHSGRMELTDLGNLSTILELINMKISKTAALSGILLITFLSLFLMHQKAFSGSSGESNKRWHWFCALSLRNDWRLLGGSADVILSDGKVKAELYDDNGFHGMSITGTIEKGRIKAVVIRHGTDDQPRKLTGMMTISEWNRSVRSSILLLEKNAGGLVIGMTVQTDS
jgi:hypothetical protein